MKIGIITLISNNYGNRLQNYAVQELLSKYGEVYTIKHEENSSTKVEKRGFCRYTPAHIKKALDSRLLNIYHLSNRRMNTLMRCIYFFKHKNEMQIAMSKRDEAFRKFDEKYIHYEKELLHLTGDDEETWIKSYDAWVCGSDQIWNPNYLTATRNAFLQFAKQERRISLSASIGISDINAMLPEYAEWINGIQYLSVREESAAEIVKALTGRTADVFLDPTMLIPLEKWNKIADEANTQLPQRFAVGYFLGVREKIYLDYIDRKTKGMPYIDLLNGEAPQYMGYGPDHVVDAIRKAEIVFVDSFHGAVFSILFHKQFVVFKRSEEGQTMNSRLQTLLKRFGLGERVYNKYNEDSLEKLIDYSEVDNILIAERVRTQTFLDRAIKDISKLAPEKLIEAKHIQVNKQEKCSGCTACSQICPKSCISMQENDEGFIYPVVNENFCIGCGVCKTVCPIIYNREGNIPNQVLAEKNKNERIRRTSSSGGVFYELAKNFIENGGVVFGCALDENMIARHVCVRDIYELEKLKSSKYVQSNMGNTMSEIKRYLLSDVKVLFSGTPCQVVGLKNYLGKDYNNLLTIDLLCHGVPSPKLFADYLEYLSLQYGGGKPITVNFRNKEHGWKRLYMDVLFDNGRRHYIYSGYDRYEGLFLNNISLRSSCYECKFAKSERHGDITLGDFWGIGQKYPQWDDDKGISVVMLNTNNGLMAYTQVANLFEGKKQSLDIAKKGQHTLCRPATKNPDRDAFYHMYKEYGCKTALEHYTKVPSVLMCLFYGIIRFCLKYLKRVMRKN